MANTQNINAVKISRNGFKPLHSDVIVEDMIFGERSLQSGIILLNDDGQGHGIRPRWGKVYAVGPEQTDVVPGQYVMVAHGRWSRGYKIQDDDGETVIRKVDPKDMLMVSDEDPGNDDTLSDAVSIGVNSMPESSKFYKGE